MMRGFTFPTRHLVLVLVLTFLSFYSVHSQSDGDEKRPDGPTDIKSIRERSILMLDEIKQMIKLRYYDKKYRGIDIEEKFTAAEVKIKTLDGHSAIFKTIAQLLLEFNDSHTVLYPPGREHRLQYGFTMQVIGNDVFVTDVKKGSDAETKGLRVGDVVRQLGKHVLSRENLRLIFYHIYYLEPQNRLRILVQSAGGAEREIVVLPAVSSPSERALEQKEKERRKKERTEKPYRCKAVNPDLIACRLESFAIERRHVDKMMSEVQGYKKFILDLRGNGGGYVSVGAYLTGHFFEREVKIADMVTRSGAKGHFAKPRKGNGFKGELVVVVDSRSASASEILARVIQIEKRGKVVGDTSAGAVMTSNLLPLAQRYGSRYVLYTLNLTIADVIMSDGNRLEHVGVVPDYPVGPSRQALSSGTDPVLAYAARLLGGELSSADAGKFEFVTNVSETEGDEASDEDPNEPKDESSIETRKPPM